MKLVPDILSTKDLSYIADAFEWNFTAAKKTLSYSKMVKDLEIKNVLRKTSSMHEKICQDLIGLLK